MEKIDINFTAEVNPDFKIKLEMCLTVQVKILHAVSHLKHPACAVLEYARDFGNTMRESLKRTTNWAAFYFTHAESYYPVPENKILLKDIRKMKQLPVKTMSKSDRRTMREWAQEHGKAVSQLTEHAAGTLPLNMYRKELPVGEGIPTVFVVLENRTRPPLPTRPCSNGRLQMKEG